MKHTIFTYKGLPGIRRIEETYTIIPFIFKETLDTLQEDPNVCLDITALMYYLRTSPENRYSANINLDAMTDDTVVIADESVAEDALKAFPWFFSESVPYDEKEASGEEPSTKEHFSWCRQPIYTYNNAATLNAILEYADKNNIPIATFSQVSGTARDEFERFNKTAELALMDLTSVSHAIENNKNLIYLIESLLNLFPNIKVIAETSRIDVLLEFFPLYFDKQMYINELLPIIQEEDEEKAEKSVSKITNIGQDLFESLFTFFDHNLIGHVYFKQRLKRSLKNYIALNKVKEQKVFSVFIYGQSGIGKTEVARLLANGLKEESYFAKINFQNYSSQDALNSLIGSPAGYIGCDHGELSDKIGKSKVGLLLCDEFDKTTRPVFLFFLELLEEGHFTDSMAREYDLDGYIIVFTSNIQSESEYKQKIPLELQTRFDLVCEFETPNVNEKRKFLELLLERAKKRHPDSFSNLTLSPEEEEYLIGFDCSDLPALRDIRRVFNNRLMELFDKKGC